MPAWTPKDDRQFEKIKESVENRGASEQLAAEIAARTVNKHRRREHRTPNKTTQGTGNPHRPLEDRTVLELQNLASHLAIRGRSKMKKEELLRAIRDSQ